MKRNWIVLIGVLAVTAVIAVALLCVGISPFFSASALVSKDFPLSPQWETRLPANIQQISVDDASGVIFARTMTKVYALEGQSGNILWEQDIAWHIPYQPILISEHMLFLADGKNVLSMNPENGNILWSQPLGSPSSAEVVAAAQGLVAVNDPPYITIYQAAYGVRLWQQDVCRENVQAYFFERALVVPCHGLTAWDAYTGDVLWTMETEPGADRIWVSAYTDGVLFASQDLENITAYDLGQRELIWKTVWKNGRSQAFKINADLVLASKEDQLCLVQREDGKILWCAGDLIKAKNPTILGGRVYLFNGLQNGITAYDLNSGENEGRLDFPAWNFITVENNQQQMAISNASLIFALRGTIYAYGE